ncbi:Exodeoxyribonuclease VII small subunit [Thermosyntropha lipolytica DSM 11003]|uniref:Exodeoxyribonuclease 7 small subunit n=1 Tax=Thermosyntropha lipolytica DSM 11003 TaxID=1123382 RepID=A0A1M5LIK0_9FIRM|nr:exodeoxyribonuclease VII small subunit [Thermosyntropha lipolytica]SHG64871.1 Exodeoxyribonuclease VII small subunit [Thermosyntropha lipolytica DSM 11003]
MENISFEEALQRLEEIVRKLENGDLSLQESLMVFEEGIKLSFYCQQELEKAEARIKKLLNREDGGWELVPFDIGEGGA